MMVNNGLVDSPVANASSLPIFDSAWKLNYVQLVAFLVWNC